MNAVVIAIAVMFILSLARVSVVSHFGGFSHYWWFSCRTEPFSNCEAFNAGLGDGAEVALAYAVLGALLWHFPSQVYLTLIN